MSALLSRNHSQTPNDVYDIYDWFNPTNYEWDISEYLNYIDSVDQQYGNNKLFVCRSNSSLYDEDGNFDWELHKHNKRQDEINYTHAWSRWDNNGCKGKPPLSPAHAFIETESAIWFSRIRKKHKQNPSLVWEKSIIEFADLYTKQYAAAKNKALENAVTDKQRKEIKLINPRKKAIQRLYGEHNEGWEKDLIPQQHWAQSYYFMHKKAENGGLEHSDELLAALKKCYKQRDRFVTQNATFRGGFHQRTAQGIASMSAFTLDFDAPVTNWDMQPAELAANLMWLLINDNKPLPSVVISSGTGIQLQWRFERNVSFHKLKWWRLTAENLCKYFTERGYTPDTGSSVDPTRVYRVPCSVNSKSGNMVYPIWFNGSSDNVKKYDYEALCDAINPEDHADYSARMFQQAEARRIAREKEQAELDFTGGATHYDFGQERTKRQRKATKGRGFRTVALHAVEDLHKIRKHKWASSIPKGKRDLWLLAAFNMVAWSIVVPDFTGMSESERAAEKSRLKQQLTEEMTHLFNYVQHGKSDYYRAQAEMGQVFKRFAAKLDGKKNTYNGKEYDPLYHYSAAKLMELLEVTDEEAEQYDLRYIASTQFKAKREAKEKAEQRGTKHYGSKDDYNNVRTKAAAASDDLIRDLYLKGLKGKAIMEETGIGRTKVYAVIKQIRDVPF